KKSCLNSGGCGGDIIEVRVRDDVILHNFDDVCDFFVWDILDLVTKVRPDLLNNLVHLKNRFGAVDDFLGFIEPQGADLVENGSKPFSGLLSDGLDASLDVVVLDFLLEVIPALGGHFKQVGVSIACIGCQVTVNPAEGVKNCSLGLISVIAAGCDIVFDLFDNLSQLGVIYGISVFAQNRAHFLHNGGNVFETNGIGQDICYSVSNGIKAEGADGFKHASVLGHKLVLDLIVAGVDVVVLDLLLKISPAPVGQLQEIGERVLSNGGEGVKVVVQLAFLDGRATGRGENGGEYKQRCDLHAFWWWELGSQGQSLSRAWVFWCGLCYKLS
ncbi:hypothetical protein EGW08_011413, partial [Elysia chlorotica]